MPNIDPTRPDDFVVVDDAAEYLRIDLKYAGSDNFTGAPVPGYLLPQAYLSNAAASALRAAAADFAELGFGLVVFDAYRPQHAVDAFVAWSQGDDDPVAKQRFYPNCAKKDLFDLGYLVRHSAHSRGSTVDLSLFDLASGALLDTGGEFDLFDRRSHCDFAGLSESQAANRERLALGMQTAGFDGFHMEWWHFTLRDEPYPDTCFDFPIR